MVHNYKRKSNRQSWDKVSMANAIKAVYNSEMGYKRAAKYFKVPQSTLERRVKIYRENPDIHKAVSKGLGRFQSVFTETQELELVEYLIELESNLVGLSTEELRLLVVQLAEKKNIPHPFKNGRAGMDWIRKFLTRHSSSLSLKKPEATSLVEIIL